MIGDIKMWGIKHQPEGSQDGRSFLSDCGSYALAFLSNKYNKGTRTIKHQPEGLQDGRSLLSDCGSYALAFLSDVYKRGTRAIKCQAEGRQDGRSMVEMLGVLAIIGVLSVGAIAGYSSAMTKHKLNKQAEQLSWLLNILHQYKSQWVFDAHFVQLVPYYKKLGLIPEDMIKDDSIYVYDAFNLKLSMQTNSCGTEGCKTVIVQYNTGNAHVPFEVCQNFFTTATAFREQLFFFGTYSEDQGAMRYTYYGDKYCTDSRLCLKNIDMDQIYNICQHMNNGQKFQPYFSFKIQD